MSSLLPTTRPPFTPPPAKFTVHLLTPKDPRFGSRVTPNWGHEGSEINSAKIVMNNVLNAMNHNAKTVMNNVLSAVNNNVKTVQSAVNSNVRNRVKTSVHHVANTVSNSKTLMFKTNSKMQCHVVTVATNLVQNAQIATATQVS